MHIHPFTYIKNVSTSVLLNLRFIVLNIYANSSPHFHVYDSVIERVYACSYVIYVHTYDYTRTQVRPHHIQTLTHKGRPWVAEPWHKSPWQPASVGGGHADHPQQPCINTKCAMHTHTLKYSYLLQFIFLHDM